HYSHKGHASVINGSGNGNSGGWKKPGYWSKSSVKKTWSGNKAFYDHT
ncbi:lactococcin 972 family bacteriocin, partial [Staphylococcus epidermidis]